MIDAPAPATPTAPPTALTDVRADLAHREVVDTTALSWEASQSGTVWRKPLYR